MDKQNVVFPYNEILLCCKKAGSTDTCNNMDESQKKLYAKKFKKATTKGLFTY